MVISSVVKIEDKKIRCLDVTQRSRVSVTSNPHAQFCLPSTGHRGGGTRTYTTMLCSSDTFTS